MTKYIYIAALSLSLAGNYVMINQYRELQRELDHYKQFAVFYTSVINSMEGGRHTLFAPVPERKPHDQ